MKAKVITVFGILILMFSCTSKMYDGEYLGEENYRNFYIVDTIKILDPIRVYSSKFGGQFIVSKANLKNYKRSAEFFTRPNVFFLGTDLYRDLTVNEVKKTNYPDNGGCTFVKSLIKFEDLEVYEFKNKPKQFLFGLINANYFYTKHNSYDSFKSRVKNPKITYYKIVYPLCD